MLSRLRLKKTLALLLLTSFIPFSISAQEQEGRFTRLLQHQPSPFVAWCFDDTAFAKIKAKIDLSDEACNLKLEKQKEEDDARYKLEIGNLQLRLDTLKKQSDNIILIKDQEIKRLEKAALKRPNDYSIWWASGGVVTGVLATLAIVYAVK